LPKQFERSLFASLAGSRSSCYWFLSITLQLLKFWPSGFLAAIVLRKILMILLLCKFVKTQFRKKNRCYRSAPATSRPAILKLWFLGPGSSVVSVCLVPTRLPYSRDYIHVGPSVNGHFGNSPIPPPVWGSSGFVPPHMRMLSLGGRFPLLQTSAAHRAAPSRSGHVQLAARRRPPGCRLVPFVPIAPLRI
jgi:hypothetical protein